MASAFTRPSTSLGTALSLSKGRKTTNQQPAGFADARAAAAALPRLHSLLVSLRGETVVEYYAKGAAAGRATNVKSASKSVISTLVGIAIDRGLIKSVNEPIVRFFPQLARDPDRGRPASPSRIC